jgi:ribosomal protein L11 methyltransferase
VNYIELHFVVRPKLEASDILIAQLAEIGYESFVETEKGFAAYINSDLFNDEELKDAILPYQQLFEIEYTYQEIHQQNWNQVWESNFEPIIVNRQCYVRAPFHASDASYKHEIVIEPKMSFGTGHHQTTRLVMAEMLNHTFENKAVLDMGCGTGILAILAFQLGAQKITAIDVDDWCVENTIENFERNKVSGAIVKKGDASHLANATYNVVIANINKNVLLHDMPIYFNALHESGVLYLSGFFETDVDELLQMAKSLGFTYTSKKVDGDWAMLLLKK